MYQPGNSYFVIRGTVRVCIPAGSLDKYRSLQHHPQCVAAYSQAGSIPSCPASCRCGQLRTDREILPFGFPGGFFDTPGLQSTHGL
jgi:hypothetical protein